jgi:type II secretory pathway component PulC
MNSFKIIIIVFAMLMSVVNVYADNHDTQKNIIDKAKEVNQKIKKEQALKEAGIASEVGKEEPLPLNDPFVGDGSLGGGSGIKVVAESEEDKRNLSVFNFKLVGIIEGSDESYASIIDENGEVLTLAAFEEIAPGVSLVGINSKEIIFDNKGESSVVINFKNQVIERNN